MASRRNPCSIASAALAVCLAAVAAGSGATPAQGQSPSGTVTISQVQVVLLVSGAVGGGTLSFGGESHDFTIGGLGIGGLRASRFEASGEVYNLERFEDLEGPYALGRAGAVAGDQQLEGGLWLINPQGVELRLSSRREGYALSLGGDAMVDRERRRDLIDAWSAMGRVGVEAGGDTATIYLGRAQWPFSIPIARGADGSWAFDVDAGREAVNTHRIGSNELDVIALLRAYVRVQAERRRTDLDGDGVVEFAAHVICSEGARNGLYWPSVPGAAESPVGDFVARAAAAGFSVGGAVEAPEPYLGYVYHVLPGQGPNAPGGTMDYIVNGQMVAGHALLAYPANYGVDGVMSFTVCENGLVLEADLGPDTLAVTAAIARFDPGSGWTPEE